MKETPIEFERVLYSDVPDRRTLIDILESISGSSGQVIKIIPFTADMTPVRLLTGKNIGRLERRVSVIKERDDICLFRLDVKTQTPKNENTLTGKFYIISFEDYKNVYVAITVEDSEFFNRGLVPIIKGLYPLAATTFVTNKKFKRLVEEFKTDNGYTDLIVNKASHRVRFPESEKRGDIISVVSWPGKPIEMAFEWVEQNNGWFKSIEFHANKKSITEADIYISREGIIKTDRRFSKVYDGFILPICKTMHENINIFGKRGRRENEGLEPKPLTIDFGYALFDDINEGRNFVNVLSRYLKASVSVLHANPYIHTSVLDYYDGSSFDIWVLDAENIIIVPQMRGSVPAIKRLINYIFDEYAEGEIKDYREVFQ